MSCVLRAYGKYFDVDKFLENSPFIPCAIFYKGKPRSSGKKSKLSKNSGFNLDISDAGFNEFEKQMVDAIFFLQQNYEEIKRLKNFPGLESLGLDFAIDYPEELFSKSIELNMELLKEIIRCDIGADISIYKTTYKKTK